MVSLLAPRNHHLNVSSPTCCSHAVIDPVFIHQDVTSPHCDYLSWFLHPTLFLCTALPAQSSCHVDSYEVFHSSNNLKRK